MITNLALGIGNPDQSLIKRYCSFDRENSTNGTIINVPRDYCEHLFAKLNWPDWGIGLLLLMVSLIILCLCLFLLVKILQSLLKGAVKNLISKVVNANFPGVWAFLTPYLAILVEVHPMMNREEKCFFSFRLDVY